MSRDLNRDRLFRHNVGLDPLTTSELELISDLYDAEIATLDREIGKFVDTLRDEGRLENTLLIIAGDHGENLGDHGFVSHMFSLHRSLRYVPLLVLFPGGRRAGEVVDEVASLTDVFPTILEACGVDLPSMLDGRSLDGDLTGREVRAILDPQEPLFDKLREGGEWRENMSPLETQIKASFDGRFHRIEYSDGRKLVYDVIADPQEQTPLEE